LSGDRSMHRWAEEFVNAFVEKEVSYEEAKHYKGDAIVCFNGRPDLPGNCPPSEFKGFKALHLMDHVFRTNETIQALRRNGVQTLLGYNKHDRHDAFFQHYYKDWVGKLIAVPFGYND